VQAARLNMLGVWEEAVPQKEALCCQRGIAQVMEENRVHVPIHGTVLTRALGKKVARRSIASRLRTIMVVSPEVLTMHPMAVSLVSLSTGISICDAAAEVQARHLRIVTQLRNPTLDLKRV